LSATEVDEFYFGFCNGTLWPLYHDGIVPAEFHRHWWRPYVAVNRKYAEAAAETTGADDIAWVQDYQLQLVPSMLREMGEGTTIGFYLHIPFPPLEIFSRLPWRRQVLEGLLGSDVLAFQTKQSADNFRRAARTLVGATNVGRQALGWQERTIHLEPAPIAIDTTDFDRLARSPEVQARAAEIRSELGDPDHLILGIDRLDYTKGIDARLKALSTLLDRSPEQADRYSLVQVAVPSREQVPAYRDLRLDIEQIVSRINGEYGQPGRVPVSYLYRSLPFDEMVAYYVAADIMLVTPLRDGMNLVAKEYAATRVNDDGVLILSEFAGAAEQLTSAVIVNPYDVEAVADAIEQAATMPPGEQKRRMRRLRRAVNQSDVFDWARNCLTMLEDA
jgi:alpha,alpha-trehalose-phosphate synthase [UDP-forming]